MDQADLPVEFFKLENMLNTSMVVFATIVNLLENFLQVHIFGTVFFHNLLVQEELEHGG